MAADKAVTKLWTKTPGDEQAVEAGCYFDLKAAEKVRDFFARFLCHSKGREWAGKPLELQPWQWEDVIGPLFGWMRANGTRRFRQAYIEIPKKSGKSTLASAVGLYMLIADGEPGAEIYSVAAGQDQAQIVHDEAVRMVDASKALQKYLVVNRSTHTISMKSTNSFYRALSAEANTKEGLNAHTCIQDELHAWKGRGLWDTLKYAGASRSQPLSFTITTAGDDMKSVCREQHDYAKAVATNGGDARFFGYIRGARSVVEGDKEDDNWQAEATWRRANPSLGVTMSVEDFAADAREAGKTPTALAAFKRYRLNIWSSGTSPWLKMEHWMACKKRYTSKDLLGQRCYGGLDLSKTRDMTAFVLAFPDEGGDDGGFSLLPWFWLPEETVSDPDSPEMYRTWAKQGLLEVTPGGVCDYSYVKRRVREIVADYDFEEYAYDPYNAEQLTQELEIEHGLKRHLFMQTIVQFAEPTKEFERQVVAGTMKHNGHPILDWQAGNVEVRSDVNNNIRPVKPSPLSHKKIDGMVAAIMAVGLAMELNAVNSGSGGFEAW